MGIANKPKQLIRYKVCPDYCGRFKREMKHSRMSKSQQSSQESWIFSLSALPQHTFTVQKHTHTKPQTYTSSSSAAEPRLNEANEIKMFRGKEWKDCLFIWENPSSDAFCGGKTDMKNEQTSNDEPIAVWLWSGKNWPKMNVCVHVCARGFVRV